MPVGVPESEPPQAPREWQTDVWRHRVEAEAVHQLEHRLRGLASAR